MKIFGWCAIISRLLVMVCSSISLYHAFSVNSTIGIIAGLILTGLYLLDVIYLLALIINAHITKDDTKLKELNSELNVAIEEEQELFNINKEP